MSDFNRKSHLKKIHKERRNKTNEKVDKAIKYLLRNEKKISINKVADIAHISRSTIYKRSDLKERIDDLRKKQSKVNSPSDINRNMNDNNKDAVIASLKREIKNLKEDKKKLKEEIKQIKKQLKENLGNIYENI
jgi:hypothetical protein